jgi:hypothetical protein
MKEITGTFLRLDGTQAASATLGFENRYGFPIG